LYFFCQAGEPNFIFRPELARLVELVLVRLVELVLVVLVEVVARLRRAPTRVAD